MAITGLASSASHTDPSKDNSLMWWWVASDNPSLVTNTTWVDRISGFTLLATAPHAPTNAGLYLQYTGTEVFSNTTAFSRTTHYTIGWIAQIPHPWGFQKYIVSENNVAIPPGLAYYNSDFVNWYVSGQGGTVAGPIVVTATIDYLADFSTLLWTGYTNGVQSRTLVESSQDNLGGTPFCIGNAPNVGVGDGLIGRVYEVLVWTNDLSSTARSNFHYYATNTYGFTP